MKKKTKKPERNKVRHGIIEIKEHKFEFISQTKRESKKYREQFLEIACELYKTE